MYRFIKSPNYNQRNKAIDAIVIHFTSSGNLEGTIAWFQNPAAKASAHYVIDRDGSIVQMVKDEDRAWHAGKSSLYGRNNVNDFSIGIELVNWGLLKYIDRKFYCWPSDYKRIYDVSEFGVPTKMGKEYWAPYTAKQLKSCKELCEFLRSKYSITAERLIGHSDVSPGRKRDPGPHFDMHNLRQSSNPIGSDGLYKQEESNEEMQNKFQDRSERVSKIQSIFEGLKSRISWISSLRMKSR